MRSVQVTPWPWTGAGRVFAVAKIADARVVGGALFVLALALRIYWIRTTGFDGLYGQDAYAYYGYAAQLLNAVSHGQLPPPFWWPLGFPAALAASSKVFGASPQAGQLVSVLAGSLTIPLAFLLVREVDGGKPLAGVLAGIVLAIGGQAVQSSIVVMSDATAVMWAVLSAWLVTRYLRTRSLVTLSASALAMVLSVLTRWENLIFACVWFAALLVDWLIRPRSRPGDSSARLAESDLDPKTSRVRRGEWVICIIALALLSLPVFLNARMAMPLAGQSWLEAWRPANWITRSFDTVDGKFVYGLPPALFYLQVLMHPAYLFPVLTPFLIVGAAWLKRAQVAWAIKILLVGWIAAGYLFLAGIPYENFRFGLGYLPPVAILAGLGLARGAEYVWQRGQSARLGFAALIIIAAAGMVAWEPRVLQPVLSDKEHQLTRIAWLSSHLPSGTRLYTFALTGALQTYAEFHVLDLSEMSVEGIKQDLMSGRPAFLFVDPANIETQWSGHGLARTFDQLRNEVTVEASVQVDGWTLYELGGAR